MLIPGEPVQIPPASPLWAQGARYGEVVRVDRHNPARALVRLPRLGRVWIDETDLLEG